MELKKKLTDFLAVEDGAIAKKSMLLTGAVLATSVLGGVVTASDQSADECRSNCGAETCRCYYYKPCGYRDCGYPN